MQVPRDDRNSPPGTGHRPAGGSAFSRIERVPPLMRCSTWRCWASRCCS
ncbi:MAG: hypothetical protein WKG07_04550 [Hymenobacter sp.]